MQFPASDIFFQNNTMIVYSYEKSIVIFQQDTLEIAFCINTVQY